MTVSNVAQKIEQISDVSQDIMRNAKEYANGFRSHYGTEAFSGWTHDIRAITYGRPFFRTIEGHDNTLFVLDIDTEIINLDKYKDYYTHAEIRELRIKAAMINMEQFLKDNPIFDFFPCISGNGMYLMQMYDKSIAKSSMFNVLWNTKGTSIIPQCSTYRKPVSNRHDNPKKECDGWHLESSDIVRIVSYDNVPIKLKIDLRMVTGLNGRLCRMPYSAYYKDKEIVHAVPIEIDSKGWNADRTLYQSNFFKMTVKSYKIPMFQFESLLDMDNTGSIVKTTRNRRSNTIRVSYKLSVPEPDDELSVETKMMLDDMDKMLTGDEFYTPPCMLKNYKDPQNRHMSRVSLIRYLAHKGNYTPSDVGTFIRFKVNDTEDNLPKNRPNLHKYTPYYYGSPTEPDLPSSCAKMQDIKSEFYACGKNEMSICKRSYCLQTQSKTQPKKKALDIKQIKSGISKSKDLGFKFMDKSIEKILKNRNTNYEVIKTTRAGVTTTLIKQAKELGKRLLVLIPTNAIGEDTGSGAMELVYNLTGGEEVKGALLSSNGKACLKLVQKRQKLWDKKNTNKAWGGGGLAYDRLSFHFKETCVGEDSICKYIENTTAFPYTDAIGIPLPLIRSDIETEMCAYQSIIQQLGELDVLFLTYDKLHALLLSGDEELVDTIKTIFNVVFLDEINQFAQKNATAVDLLVQDDEGNIFDIFEQLENDLTYIRSKRGETAKTFIEIIEIFIETYRSLVLDWESKGKFTIIEDEKTGVERSMNFIMKMKNPLSPDQQRHLKEEFSSFYRLVEEFTTKENVHLLHLERITILLTSETWWIQNIAGYGKPINCSIIAAPIVDDTLDFVKYFDETAEKQVIVTDATMPLIKMSDLFDIDFERFVIGDPRNTNDHQLIISDNKKIFPYRFFIKGREDHMQDLVDLILEVSATHDARNVMVVAPNKKLNGVLHKFKAEKIIPSTIQITYFRSDRTVGIASNRRVMIAVCSPDPPTGAFMWLASYYHERGLHTDDTIRELSAKLEKMNTHQTYYQTIGRVKDPANLKNSIVYNFGIDTGKLREIIQMDKDVPIPKTTYVPYNKGKKLFFRDIGVLWQQYRVMVHPAVLRIITHLRKKNNAGKKFTLAQLRRSLRLNTYDVKQINNTNPVVFDYFGLLHNIEGKTIYLFTEE